ncbi:MAG: hypothetical protein IJE18_06880 [Bacteroidaceae bacterium]|nr:hypothetical protein [Bacteroidaceae bacterium]
MKSFITTFFQKNNISKTDIKINNFLCNKTWYIFNEDTRKEIYIFRENNELVIAVDGKVTRGKWEYIAENHSVIIDADGKSVMLHPTFIDNNIFVLQLDGKNEFAFLIEESKVLNSPFRKLSDIYSYFDNLQRQIEQEKEAKKQRLLLQKIEEEREEQRRLERIKEEEENRLLKERRLKWWNENKAKFLSNEKKYIKLVEEYHKIVKKRDCNLFFGSCNLATLIIICCLVDFTETDIGLVYKFGPMLLAYWGILYTNNKAIKITLIAYCIILFLTPLFNVSIEIEIIAFSIAMAISALCGYVYILYLIIYFNDNPINNKTKEIFDLEEEIKNNLINGKYDHLIF